VSALTALALFAAVFITLIVPGQDFVTVVRLSVTRSRSAGIAAAGGVSTGLLVWSLASLLGVAALLEHHADLGRGLRMGGAVVLAGFGLYAIFRALVPARAASADATGTGSAAIAATGLRGWATGLLSNLSNVKLLVFFGSIFSGFVPHGIGLGGIALIACGIAAMSFGWFGLVAVLGSHPRLARLYLRAGRSMDVAFGLVFIAIAAIVFCGALAG